MGAGCGSNEGGMGTVGGSGWGRDGDWVVVDGEGMGTGW